MSCQGTLIGIALVAAASGPLAFGAGSPPMQPHESFHGYYIPPLSPRTTSPGRVIDHNGFVSVQVNVDPNGTNIVGDAANEPSIAVDPTDPNRMVIVWRQFDTIQSDFRQAGRAYTQDGGQSWVFPGALQPGVFRSDPVVDTDPNGVFYFCSSLEVNFIITVFRSLDGGVSWDNGVQIYGGDKPWQVIDDSSGPGRGSIYCVWAGGCSFTRSLDHGVTFSSCTSIPFAPFYGTLAVGPDSELYVAGLNAAPDGFARVKVSKSTNAFVPQLTPQFVTRTVDFVDLFMPFAVPNPVGLIGQVWVVVDTSSGPRRGWAYLLVTIESSIYIDARTLLLSRSTDGGVTWSAPIRVHDDNPDTYEWRWFPTMSISPNGRLDVVWIETPAFDPDYTSHLRYTWSADGATTWAPSVDISPTFLAQVGYPQQAKLGDYYDMTSDDEGAFLAYAATFNGEQDVYYMRIESYDCNHNGVDDRDELAAGLASDCNDNGMLDTCEPAFCFGDANCDGAVDFFDIDPFVALLGCPSVGDCLGDCPWQNADCEHDCDVDFFDIDPFVARLGTACP